MLKWHLRVQSRALHMARFRVARGAPRAACAPRVAVEWWRPPGLKSWWGRRPIGRHWRSSRRQGTATVFAASAVTLASCGGLVYCGDSSAALQRDRAQGRAAGARQETVAACSPGGVHTLLRAAQLGLIFCPTFVIAPFALISESVRSLWYDILAWCFSKAGPTFIKLGQWLSTRPDIFPIELCQKMSFFHENVPAEPWSLTIQETVEAATCDAGQTLADVFVAFDRVPIGSGCVAQVYRARLRRHGDGNNGGDEDGAGIEVAVKIKRPDADAKISADLHLMRIAAHVLTTLFPQLQWINLKGCAAEFSDLLNSQLDFRREASNLHAFRRNFGEWDGTIGFPRPISRLCSRNVLIETFEEGVSLSAMLNQKEKQAQSPPFSSKSQMPELMFFGNEKHIADVGSRAFFEMVLVHNFVHADLHPGNILVQHWPTHGSGHESDKDANDTGPSFRRLVFLDAGLTTSLSKVGRQNFIDLFSAVCDANGELAARLMIERSEDPRTCVDADGFVNGMRELIDHVADTTFSLGQVRIGQVLLRVMDLCQRHHVRVDDTMAQLVSSIAILDGLGRQLDPDRDLFDTARPILKRFFSLHPDYRKLGARSLRKVVNGLPKTSTKAQAPSHGRFFSN